MFIRASLITIASVLAIPMLAVASPTPAALTEPASCNSGTAHCCESMQKPGDPKFGLLAGLLDVVVPVNLPIGLNCSPISILGGGNQCNHLTVCCSGNSFNGLIVVGCSPVNVSL